MLRHATDLVLASAFWCLVLTLACGVVGQPVQIAGYTTAAMNGGGTTIVGPRMTINHGSGNTLVAQYNNWAPENILQMPLLGNKFSFVVDLSGVGCACNLAVYLISMPARGWDGNFNPGTNRGGQPPYYCDANQVGGQWCPEIDIMEANNHAFQATPHKCDWPQNGVYGNCDRGGCGQNTRDSPNAYGFGDWFTINTMRPFAVSATFNQNNGVFSGMTTVLEQEGRQVVLDHSNCGEWYYRQLSDVAKSGMSLRITYWGESAEQMSWLDSPPCGGETCSSSAGVAVITDMALVPLSPPDWAAVMRRYVLPDSIASQLPNNVATVLMTAVVFLAFALVALSTARLRRVHCQLEEQTPTRSGVSPGKYSHLESGGAFSPVRFLTRRPASNASVPDEDSGMDGFEISPHRRRVPSRKST